MTTPSDQQYKVYEKPDYTVLETAAKELGVTLTINRDMQLAEDLFQRGIKTPFSEQGWSPREMVSIQQLLPVILEKHEIPNELRVYLVDRGFIEPGEETVGSLLIRKKEEAFNNLLEGVKTLTTLAKERNK